MSLSSVQVSCLGLLFLVHCFAFLFNQESSGTFGCGFFSDFSSSMFQVFFDKGFNSQSSDTITTLGYHISRDMCNGCGLDSGFISSIPSLSLGSSTSFATAFYRWLVYSGGNQPHLHHELLIIISFVTFFFPVVYYPTNNGVFQHH